jgi:hypothetical protein
MEDLYNYSGSFDGFQVGNENSAEILKAMEAGLKTGMQYNNEVNTGGGLKVESLDAVLKVLTNRLDQLVYLNEMPKDKIDNTVHEYNQLSKYGEEVGIFNAEGETPEETDSQYIRRSIVAKFMGVTGQVTHPAMLVKLAGGVKMYAREVENKTLLLQTMLDRRLVDADSSCVPEQFDGIFRQHMIGVVTKEGGTIEGMTSENVLDAYFNDPAVVDADGSILLSNPIRDNPTVLG